MPDTRMHLKPIHIHIAKSLLLQKQCTHTHGISPLFKCSMDFLKMQTIMIAVQAFFPKKKREQTSDRAAVTANSSACLKYMH